MALDHVSTDFDISKNKSRSMATCTYIINRKWKPDLLHKPKPTIIRSIPVTVLTESSARLYKVVVHHSQYSEVAIFIIAVLSKAEVKARFQPVCIGPTGKLLVGWVAEPSGIRFAHTLINR